MRYISVIEDNVIIAQYPDHFHKVSDDWLDRIDDLLRTAGILKDNQEICSTSECGEDE